MVLRIELARLDEVLAERGDDARVLGSGDAMPLQQRFGGVEHRVVRRADGTLDVPGIEVARSRHQSAFGLGQEPLDAHAEIASLATCAMNGSAPEASRSVSTNTGATVFPYSSDTLERSVRTRRTWAP